MRLKGNLSTTSTLLGTNETISSLHILWVIVKRTSPLEGNPVQSIISY
jgi:hypothetical protein